MVHEQLERSGTTVFTCEFCGSGYRDIQEAEDCEQHCSTRGFASVEIRWRAARVPRIVVVAMR